MNPFPSPNDEDGFISETILIWAHPSGRWCGVFTYGTQEDDLHYVGYVQTDLDTEEVKSIGVHGGVTLVGERRNSVWVGWDTNHAGDVNYDENGNRISGPPTIDMDVTKWNPSIAVAETNLLAKKLAAMERKAQVDRTDDSTFIRPLPSEVDLPTAIGHTVEQAKQQKASEATTGPPVHPNARASTEPLYSPEIDIQFDPQDIRGEIDAIQMALSNGTERWTEE